ncbi:ComEA family DNA-binding protein [Croceimicrobium sp.]|uniref:ComEA family DNA-binding protein n=1 Tax=Croceimicrobium sp. TaxID=2828340 RepID=UPI003BAB52A7
MYPSTERALIFLAALVFILAVLEWNYEYWFPPPAYYTEEEIAAIKLKWQDEDRKAEAVFNKALYAFDPNRPDTMQLADLGLNPGQIHSWKNYLKKGGRFRKAEDLFRLYALDSTWVVRVLPYLKVEESEIWKKDLKEELFLSLYPFNPNQIRAEEMEAMGLPSSAIRGILSFREKYRPFKSPDDIFSVYAIDSALAQKLHPYIIVMKEGGDSLVQESVAIAVEINQADSLQLLALPGLGPYRTQRILAWRQRLGGFHNLRQLMDHHLIDSISLGQLELYLLFNVPPKQLSLNYDSMDNLQAHPYINYYLARSIIDFREQVRAFKSVDELRNFELVDAVLFSKLAPYLKVSQKDTNAANLSN